MFIGLADDPLIKIYDEILMGSDMEIGYTVNGDELRQIKEELLGRS